MYFDKNGESTNKKPSISGYGVYVNDENPTTNRCINQGYWQYDFTKYLSFGLSSDLQIDKKSTTSLLKSLVFISETQKLFIEPYLKHSLSLENESKIRFHGCQAVRHDDHIHLQIK
ncbi:hypothetical protein [Winogradskyella sp. A3E31]|uniref:hypothetical protein n=1 Tax=Winogradskyella sp. A3E31 TaxID=3349637 RepID=UPI00398ABD53